MDIYVVKRNGRRQKLDISKIRTVLKFAFDGLDNVDPMELELDSKLKFYDGMKTTEIHKILIDTAVDKISPQNPNWTYVAARLLLYNHYKEVAHTRGFKLKDKITRRYTPYNGQEFLNYLRSRTFEELGKYYNAWLIDFLLALPEDRFLEFYSLIKPERDLLFTYPGLYTLIDRYLIKDENKQPIELPQELYLLTALTLELPNIPDYLDDENLERIKTLYDLLSTHRISLATPILLNARRKKPQTASCFVLTIEDSLDGIFEIIKTSAHVSKYAGGLGIYIGKLRALNSSIQNHTNVCSGVIPVVRLLNDTMSYVDQLGMRKGSACLTLDIWHKDIIDFLQVRTNAGDERYKAHDIHTAVSIPDLFMNFLREKKDWLLLDPYESKYVLFEHYIIPKTIEALKQLDMIKDVSVKWQRLVGRAQHDIEVKLTLTVDNDKHTYNDPVQMTEELGALILYYLLPKYALTNHVFYMSINSHVQADKYVFLARFPTPSIEDYHKYSEPFTFDELYTFLYENQHLLKNKKLINSFELWKTVLTVAFETGEPYIFYRDNANKENPNSHRGMIYSSNLCQEIAQNMGPRIARKYDYETFKTRLDRNITLLNGKEIYFDDRQVVEKREYIVTDEVVCNLGALNLGKLFKKEELEHAIACLVRTLDNSITYASLPIEHLNDLQKYRAIGIGVANYHYRLVKEGIRWESEDHVEFAFKLFELIMYYTLKHSALLARELDPYPAFEGSSWSKGLFKNKYTFEELTEISHERGNKLNWTKLYKDYIQKYGLRNGYFLAVMPTGSTSIIIGATPSIDPIFAKFYKEENITGILPQVPPEIDKYYWHYKTAYTIDHTWTIKAAAARQFWIDQAQSLNLFIDPQQIDGPTLSRLYELAWEEGLKTIYYLRSKSITDIEECESCSV